MALVDELGTKFNGVEMLALLDSQDFDMQANLFKIIMKNNAKYSLMGIA